MINRLRRIWHAWPLIAALLIASGSALLVRGDGTVVIETVPHLAVPLDVPVADDVLLVQATHVPGSVPRYVLTLSNLSPWALGDVRVLDRFFAAQSELEQSSEWLVERLGPGESASFIFVYENVDPPACCHQVEMNWTGGFGAYFVDDGEASRTSLRSIPLSAEMALPEEEIQAISFEAPVGRSKLGLHVTRNASPEIMAFVRDTQPAVLVGVGDLGWLADAKAASPNTITLGRFEELDQSLDGDPEARAQAFVSTHAARYLSNPGVDYWLGWNEPNIGSIADMGWYARFEAERARLMDGLGLRVAVGNFSTGTPEADEFAAFVPAIEAAERYGGILSLHEYSAPGMADGVGLGIPGQDPEAEAGTLTLRYRYWYEHYLGPAGLVIPLVITETGIDGGVLGGESPQLRGWRDFAATSLQGGFDTYLSELSWYDDELRRDPYVIGCAVINAGDPDGRWSSYDVTAELDALASEMVAKE